MGNPKVKYPKVPFFDRLFVQGFVSLCIPGYPETQFVEQAGLELRDPPASPSRVPPLPDSTVPFLLVLSQKQDMSSLSLQPGLPEGSSGILPPLE